ncbi:MAG: response regulator transcription factor [Ekhidna sp.]|nr:response regulator transcription factor [Ekhidna sp.]
MSPIKILLVDDHEIFLDGLVTLLKSVPTFEIVGTATNRLEALQKIPQVDVDLILTDLSMPQMSGLELVKNVKRTYPKLKLLVLTMHDDRPTVSEIIMAEAEGYLLKNTSKKQIINAINKVHEGSTYYANEVMNIILNRMKQEQKEQVAAAVLTDRELEILRLIAEEKSSEEIADQLFISKRTVDTHRTNMLKKTEKSTVVGLLKYAVQCGLIAL